MSDRVTLAIREGIADVRLNRPEKHNALDLAMFEALHEVGRSLATEQSLRAVLLSGEGPSFCAGLDFSAFAAMAGGEGASGGSGNRGGAPRSLLERGAGSPANFAQRAAWVWTEVAVPVIAAVHGVAYGGGLQIALGADVRLVSPDARLSVREIQWGLIPDMSGTQTLRHLVRLDVAKELTFTGRVLTGTEAAALGLATRTSESPRDEAFEMAREIAARSPDAVRAAKRLLNRSVQVGVEEGLRLEEEIQMSLIGGRNQVEAVKANLEKREPRFEDPDKDPDAAPAGDRG